MRRARSLGGARTRRRDPRDNLRLAASRSCDPAGQATNARGWVHFGNRWYNPTLGRWTQQDTLDAPLDPTNANRYAYAGCDPINNSDPTGRCTLTEALSVTADAGTVAGLATGAVALFVGAFVPVSAPVGAAATLVGGLVGANIGAYTYIFTC
ncbi:RHS repeat-associated core domain-containing protein [Microbacterium sp. zg.Y909]|nr:RHS repeat-associated core domain-containing protein [Microbacterium sp. zg.Y909]